MKTQLNFPTPSSPIFFSLPLLLLLHFPLSFTTATTDRYTACANTFNCGEISGIDYPFYGGERPKECGHPNLNLKCSNNTSTTISILNVNYQILKIDQINQILTIKRNDLTIGNICSEQFFNTTIDSSLFEYTSNYINLTIQYGCPPLKLPFPQQFECTINGIVYDNNYIVPGDQGAGPCNASKVIQVHSSVFGGIGDLWDVEKLIEGGFEVKWKVDSTECKECKNSGGSCGFDSKANRFDCACPGPDQPPQGSKSCGGGAGAGVNVVVDPEGGPQSHSLTAPNSGGKGKSSTSINIILPIVGAVLAGIGFGWVIFYCRQRRKRLAVQSDHFSSTDKKELPTTPLANKDSLAPPASIAFTKSIPSYPSTKFDSRTETSFFGARIFTYTELEEATEDFAETRELGDGGFGAVYYGVLSDGSVVAVKRLYENNYKRVEQFKNEVEILTRLRHPNLVMLYGCSSKRSKDLLLVYEYVPNGTVADHLHGNRASSGLLSWPVRLNIAIETAEALAYLHASDIIHRDVKTNNILLDNDFHVKVADFGLSRLFPVDATHVSTAPQGTPGYVDPEYYQWYQLTEKSDVYSFGVVLVELISSLPAVDTNRSRQDINLASMAINKIQNHAVHELVDQSLQFHANSSVKKMVTLVAELAFRCLQQEKDMRPSMQEVLETLQGIQSGGLNAQKVEVVDILVDDCRSCKDGTLPPSPDSVTDKSTSTSAKTSSG